MRNYKNIQFGEGITSPLSEFKKEFEPVLRGLTDNEVKEAYKVATNGNITRTITDSPEDESEKRPTKLSKKDREQSNNSQ